MSELLPAFADQSDNNQPNQSSAFAAALIKAKQIAAKIKPDGDSDSPTQPIVGQKRPLEEDSEGPSDKRQSFGMATQVTSEQVMVPDKMVGLIIGKGGEQITRLQAETGCKIQMAADSGGMPERLCTLTGPMSAIAQAKVMIEGIIANEGAGGQRPGGGPGGMPGGGPGGVPGGGGGGHFEIMIPGHKVGLVIGKGGETIKLLQEQTGAKMIIIQESNQQADQKPLRITGAPEQVELAKAEVFKILNANDNRGGMGVNRGGYGGGAGRGRGGGGGGAGWPSNGAGGDKVEYVMVSSNKVGLVIGKGGETIKSINQASGAHVEIDRNAPPDATEKNFIIKGSAEAVERAKNMVLEKIGAIEGSGYGAFPGQTFIPGGGGRGGGGGGHYGGGGGGHYGGGGPPQAGGPAINPATGQPDYSAQWADYYRSLGMTKEAEMIEQQMPAAPQPAPVAAAPAATPDYSAQWAEYYRSIGKVKEAEQIESQIRAKNGGGAPAGGQPQPYGGQPQYYQPQGGYPS